MKKQKYLIISVSGNRYYYEFDAKDVSDERFRDLFDGVYYLNVKDQQGHECFLMTEKIETFYKN